MASLLSAQDAAKKDAKEAPKPSEFHKVATAPFSAKADLDAYVTTAHEHAVILESESWGDYEIIDFVQHGTRVKKGDVLISFDRESYDKAVAAADRRLQVSAKNLAINRAGLALARKSSALDGEDIKRVRDEAAEERRYYRETSRPMAERSSFETLKSSRNMLAYAQEELNQLLAMYEADDLVEETEEIIIQRAKYSVESAKFRLEGAELRHARTIETSIPRQSQVIDEALDRAELALAHDKKVRQAGLEVKQIEFDTAEIAHEELAKKFTDLQKDTDTFELRAPADGVVVWGKSDGGRWIGLADMSKKLRVHGKLMRREHVFTVISGAPELLLSSAKPEQMELISNGAKGIVSIPGRSDAALATVTEMGGVPGATGTFRLHLKASLPKDLAPGSKVKIRFPAEAKPRKAVAVPAAAIGTSFEGGKVVRFVTLKNGDRRNVEIGASSGGKTEITKGLKEGEEIHAKQP